MDIAQIRQKYPQYNDMSNEQLADSLYTKSYSDMPRSEFDKKIGYKEPTFIDRAQSAGKDLGNSAINLGLDVASGLALGTGDLLNLVSGGDLYKAMGGRPPSFNEMLHRPQNFVDNFVQGASEFAAPGALVSKGAKAVGAASQGLGNIARQGATSGLLGGFSHATGTGGNPALEGVVGLAGGAVAPYIPNAIGAVIKAPSAIKQGYNEFLLNNVAPKVFQKELTTVDSPENIMNATEQLIRSGHKKEFQSYKNINAAAEDIAKKVDATEMFDSTDYINALEKIKASKNPIRDAEELADINQLILTAPKTYEEAVKQRVFINSLPHSSATKTARDSLINSVEEATKVGNKDIKEFNTLWKEGNKQYATKVAPFYKVHDPYDLSPVNNRLKKSLQNDEADAQGNLANLYAPKGQRVDTLNQQHLASLIGENEAMKASRASYFKDVYAKSDEGYFPTRSFLTKYSKLSDFQKEAMFPKDKISLLDLATEAVLKGKETSKISEKIGGGVIGATLGEGAGQLLGVPAVGGTLGGISGTLLGEKFVDKLLSKYLNSEEFLKLSKATKRGRK